MMLSAIRTENFYIVIIIIGRAIFTEINVNHKPVTAKLTLIFIKVIYNFFMGFCVVFRSNHFFHFNPLLSTHKGLCSCPVDKTSPGGHLATLRPPLDFHQHFGQGLVGYLVPTGVPVPQEQRAGHAGGEGDQQGFLGFHSL
jgi:hypothetical protein